MNKGWQHNYELGKKAFEDRKYDVALSYLERVSKEKSGFADVFNMLGLIYYSFSRIPEAILSFKKAVEINPNYTEACLNLSVVYNEVGQFDKSCDTYTKARESRKESESYLDPYVKGKLANMHAGLGRIYKDLGMYAEAADEYRKALCMRADFVDIKTELGVVYRDMKDYSNALVELESAKKLHKSYPAPRIHLGLTYYAMGQYDRAKSEWLEVLDINPDNQLANMYMSLVTNPPCE
ncbi:MAG: tetratricopeptide repeat protein [Deltaproteobacteria bacterium]